MNAQKVTAEAPPLERRSFLGAIAAMIGGAIGAVFSIAAGRFAIEPALSSSTSLSIASSGSSSGAAQWMEIGALEEIPESLPVKRRIVVSQPAGWGLVETPRAVFVVRNGERIKVFSATCPHLGCAISAQGGGFRCACHGSIWSRDGERVSGPAPRAMDELEHRIEDGALRVRYEEFRQGIAQKEAIG